MRGLGVFDDTTLELEKSLENIALNIQNTATPLPVATRGVGFAVVAEYSCLCAAWSIESVQQICTVHQYYRMVLHLINTKIYYASSMQGERPSFSVALPVTIEENIRQVVCATTEVPISTCNILSAIRKIQGFATWHSYAVVKRPLNGVSAALYLYPDTIRDTLDRLSDPDTPAEYRTDFHNHNPLPGANWIAHEDSWLLENIDEIWPAGYGINTLIRDSRAYNELLSQVSGRLPRGFISSFSWTGLATRTGLTSMDVLPMRLSARFTDNVYPDFRRKRRDVCGRVIDEGIAVQVAPRYLTDSTTDAFCETAVWSPDGDTQSLELVAGSATFVREHVGQPTRSRLMGKTFANLSPGEVFLKFVELPRSPSAS